VVVASVVVALSAYLMFTTHAHLMYCDNVVEYCVDLYPTSSHLTGKCTEDTIRRCDVYVEFYKDVLRTVNDISAKICDTINSAVFPWTISFTNVINAIKMFGVVMAAVFLVLELVCAAYRYIARVFWQCNANRTFSTRSRKASGSLELPSPTVTDPSTMGEVQMGSAAATTENPSPSQPPDHPHADSFGACCGGGDGDDHREKQLTHRSFTISGSDIGYKGGWYIISSNEEPLLAAMRAATKLFSKLKKPEYRMHAMKDSIKFILCETTSGMIKSTGMYKAKRTLRKEIMERRDKDGNLLYVVNYDYVVKACIMPNTEDDSVPNLSS
jgi:hypothetical protein